ncbi:hypothetical protein [Streptomyces griseorubiginosus]|uniref:hypothetical protein n=1 Tax=Streptomyces griseorubiginosus TaxID=67304 RepID=UPI0036EBD165
MRKKIITLVVAAALAGATAPALGDASVRDGKVGLSVKGTKLKVRSVSGWMDGHGTGVKARLYTVRSGVRTDLTRWKDATPRSYGMTQLSDVNWDWNRKPKKFGNGTLLCIEFNKAINDNPCARIHS